MLNDPHVVLPHCAGNGYLPATPPTVITDSPWDRLLDPALAREVRALGRQRERAYRLLERALNKRTLGSRERLLRRGRRIGQAIAAYDEACPLLLIAEQL